MEAVKDDGGFAFPCPMVPIDGEGGYTEVRFGGMTLRDYLAAHATSDDIHAFMRIDAPTGEMIQAFTREEAKYRYADAMLKARQQ